MKETSVEAITWREATLDNFTGPVWISSLSEPDQPDGVRVLGVSFAPGSRSDWHSHPDGQVLYVVTGRGVAVTREGSRVLLTPGSTLTAQPGELHWHGASADSPMIHLSITTGGGANWVGQKVSDDEYNEGQPGV